ncbi:MAG: anaerobic ribonucleoside-triphosphate reductase [Candidatus Bathyarchaeota archaeon]|nr:MAG: anaerobic ribonucleoside-triphosphate reductase [Candidatus Bathyarchaeota archaeon]
MYNENLSALSDYCVCCGGFSTSKQEYAVDSLKYFPRVRTSRIMFENFNPQRIRNSLVKETGLLDEVADKIALDIAKRINTLDLEFLSGPLIREFVCVALLENNLERSRARYTRLGLPLFDVDRLISAGDKENANLQHNPETIHKLAADTIFDQYTLLNCLPPHLADAHIAGAIHVHDLEYFATRPFCQEHDLRFFLKKGLVVDGQGVHTAVAGPAKHAEVAILHAAKALAAAQTNWAGGQGYDFFNVWLAPFVQGMPYERMKQLAQMFIYEMSQMYVARGGQTVFSSIALECAVPKIIWNMPAVLPGGKVSESETYFDYFDEANAFFNAILDVYMGGDYLGKPFNFPKCEVKLRPEYLDKFEREYVKVAALAAKFGTPYFLNLCPSYMPDIVNSQCCRLIFAPDSDELEDFNKGAMRMGSLQVVTVNLPRLGYEANGNDGKLFELLNNRMDLAKDVLLIKRDVIRKRMQGGTLPFCSMDCFGEPYLNLDKQVLNVGFVGLNELLKIHLGTELHEDPNAWRFGLRVIRHMVERVNKYAEETGYRFGCIQTPAESCAHRLALVDRKIFGDDAIVQGDVGNGGIYYTNSSHVRPSAGVPLLDRLKIESSFHPLTKGGAIMHIWLGESNPSAESIWSFIKRVATESLAAYFALTRDMTICRSCNSVEANLQVQCKRCGAGNDYLEHWSRITGYYQQLRGWNAGKVQEFKDRHRYTV